MKIDPSTSWLKAKSENIPFSKLIEASPFPWESVVLPAKNEGVEATLYFTDMEDERIELILITETKTGAESPLLLPTKKGVYEPLHKAEFLLEHVCSGSVSQAEATLRNLAHTTTTAKLGLARSMATGTKSDEDGLEERVEQVLLNLRATERAKEILRDEKIPMDSGLELLRLNDWLQQEDRVPTYRVEGLWPSDGNVHLVASYKSGKTTLVLNLIRSLVDGEHFLGRFPVRKVLGRVLYINYELSELMTKRWFRKLGIKATEKVSILNLRGRSNPLETKKSREIFATQIADLEIEVVVIDPFSGAFSHGKSQDNDEVKAFLIELDRFAIQAGIKEILIAVHAGYEPLKPRGASSLGDHPDALWYVWKPDKNSNQRNFKADGRDIEVGEEALTFEEETMTLALSGLSGAASANQRVRDAIIQIVREKPGSSASDIESSITGSKARTTRIREELRREGLLIEKQKGKSKAFYVVEGSSAPPPPSI